MPRVGPPPLSDVQRDALLLLVVQAERGVRVVDLKSSGNNRARATMRSLERRGLAEFTCDRKPNGAPVFHTWRYVVTKAGLAAAQEQSP